MKPSQSKKYLGLVMLAILASACGSNKPKDTLDDDAVSASSDAGTDTVPLPTAETPNAPAAQPVPTPSATPDQTAGAPLPPPPAAAPPPAPAPAEQTQSDSYTVQGGDTLMKIAFEIYGDVYKWKDIYEANKDAIKDPNNISNGITLKVERPASPPNIEQNGEKYLIKRGDTLGKISNSVYGTSSRWKEIWQNNKHLIHDPNKIFAGFYLYYSTGSSVLSQAPATPAGDAPAPADSAASNTPIAPAGAAPAAVPPPAADPGTSPAAASVPPAPPAEETSAPQAAQVSPGDVPPPPPPPPAAQ